MLFQYTPHSFFEQYGLHNATWIIYHLKENMFPHWKKSGMGEHKTAKNMFPTYTNRHNFEQLDILNARGKYHIAFIKNGITKPFININQRWFYLSKGKSALSGAIAGALAGGLFGGIKYGLSAGKIARGVSGLKNAESNLTNAFSPLKNIKSLAKMPFSNTNIFRSIGQAASNFNNAYSAYVFAKATYTAVNIAASATYFLLENLTSELLGLVL